MTQWLAGQRITAERLRAGQGVWQPYTPAWTASTINPIVGNGQLIGRWMQIGNTVDFTIRIVWGSSTNAGAGIFDFGLPALPTSWGAGSNFGGLAQCVIQISGNRFTFGVMLFSTGLVRIANGTSSGLGASGYNGQPWRDGDLLLLSGRYEVPE